RDGLAARGRLRRGSPAATRQAQPPRCRAVLVRQGPLGSEASGGLRLGHPALRRVSEREPIERAAAGIDRDAFERVSERARELASGYAPPTFEHVPDPDSALFLSAVDHRTGYRRAHEVGAEGPLEGSALMW